MKVGELFICPGPVTMAQGEQVAVDQTRNSMREFIQFMEENGRVFRLAGMLEQWNLHA